MSPLPPIEKNDEINKSLSKYPVLSTPSLFVQSPFSFLKPNIPTFLPLDLLHNFHKTVTSTSHHFFHFLHFSASQNPFLNTLLSFSSQVRLRNCRSLNSLSSHNFAAVLPGDSVAGIVVSNGILNFLNLYNTVLVVRLVLTWFPSAPPQIVSPLSTLCDPYLNIFRGIIPPLGGTLDLSPILAFLVLNAFTSAATALPAELPTTPISEVTGQQGLSRPGCLSDLTFSQKKWQRRLQGHRSNESNSPK